MSADEFRKMMAEAAKRREAIVAGEMETYMLLSLEEAVDVIKFASSVAALRLKKAPWEVLAEMACATDEMREAWAEVEAMWSAVQEFEDD